MNYILDYKGTKGAWKEAFGHLNPKTQVKLELRADFEVKLTSVGQLEP